MSVNYVKYEFLTGDAIEIEVTDEFKELVVQIEKDDFNHNRRETRKHVSVDALQLSGFQLKDISTDIYETVVRYETEQALHEALNQLSPQQRQLIYKVFFEQQTLVEIAKKESVSEGTIRYRLKLIYKKLQKDLNYFTI